MNDIIRLLPEAIANQIAAGEVVQRPASALKELLENAVDAGATQVQVLVKEAGKMLIQVMDNGNGMSITDARMSFERHATSKIRTSEDLFAIRTFGFRGEALASIAAVAQVEMKTRQKGEELGTHLCIEGSEVKKQEPATCPTGTSVSVKNLFYNVPARRNFLKSNAVEMRHLVDEFQRVAISYPEIGFIMFQNDMELFNLVPGKLSQRIVDLFGKYYQGQLLTCREETLHVNIKGYIGKPQSAKKTRGDQFFFVNNRFIKSNYLHHAVNNAFEGLILSDQHPFYVLFLDLDPSHIDINVHPTKTEIKFDDEKTIYSVVFSAVKQALGAHNVVPSLDFSFDVNFSDNWNNKEKKMDEVGRENSYKVFGSPTFIKKDASGWEKLFDKQPAPASPDFERLAIQNNDNQELRTYSSLVNGLEQKETIGLPLDGEDIGFTFQVDLTYIVARMSRGLLIMDQQASHERILYEKYKHQLIKSAGSSQQCLFPQSINLSPADYALVLDLKEDLTQLGFSFTDFGNHSILINGIPADVSISNEKSLFEALLEQFKHFKSTLSLDKKENLARSLAKKSALKKGAKLNAQEMETLVGQLFACQNPNYGLSGNKTFVKLDINKIQTFFNP